jgi:hypothetical protein
MQNLFSPSTSTLTPTPADERHAAAAGAKVPERVQHVARLVGEAEDHHVLARQLAVGGAAQAGELDLWGVWWVGVGRRVGGRRVFNVCVRVCEPEEGARLGRSSAIHPIHNLTSLGGVVSSTTCLDVTNTSWLPQGTAVQ